MGFVDLDGRNTMMESHVGHAILGDAILRKLQGVKWIDASETLVNGTLVPLIAMGMTGARRVWG